MKVLLQRSWDQRARDDSLREASEGMHTEVVKALVERLGSVSEKVFERALQVAVTRGSMALFTALLTNVTSDLAVLRQCLSTVVTPACRFGQVRMQRAPIVLRPLHVYAQSRASGRVDGAADLMDAGGDLAGLD